MSEELKGAIDSVMTFIEASRRSDRIELAGQINEAVQEYARMLGDERPSDAEALAIGLTLSALKKLVASWEPKK